jgi:hypothetical protein
MKYSVATLVSGLLGGVLIGAGYVQIRRVEQLHAALSALDIHALAVRYWECQPRTPGEPYKRDSAYCAEVNRAMEARANEMPALQLVKVSPPQMILPEAIALPKPKLQKMKVTPTAPVMEQPQPIFPARVS